jgi:hypothetical protein
MTKMWESSSPTQRVLTGLTMLYVAMRFWRRVFR